MEQIEVLLSCAEQAVGWPAKISLAYLVIVGIASTIVKVTPTLKDDNIFKNVMRFLGKYVSLNR